MSVRTIIEINHDMLHQLERDGILGHELTRHLAMTVKYGLLFNGLRIMAQRHHSESVKVLINGHTHYDESHPKSGRQSFPKGSDIDLP